MLLVSPPHIIIVIVIVIVIITITTIIIRSHFGSSRFWLKLASFCSRAVQRFCSHAVLR